MKMRLKMKMENQMAKADRRGIQPRWPCAKPNQEIASIQNSSLNTIPYMLMTHNPLCIANKKSIPGIKKKEKSRKGKKK